MKQYLLRQSLRLLRKANIAGTAAARLLGPNIRVRLVAALSFALCGLGMFLFTIAEANGPGVYANGEAGIIRTYGGESGDGAPALASTLGQPYDALLARGPGSQLVDHT